MKYPLSVCQWCESLFELLSSISVGDGEKYYTGYRVACHNSFDTTLHAAGLNSQMTERREQSIKVTK